MITDSVMVNVLAAIRSWVLFDFGTNPETQKTVKVAFVAKLVGTKSG